MTAAAEQYMELEVVKDAYDRVASYVGAASAAFHAVELSARLRAENKTMWPVHDAMDRRMPSRFGPGSLNSVWVMLIDTAMEDLNEGGG